MQNHPPHNNSVQANHAVQMWFLYYMIKDSGYPDIKAQNENNDEAREGKRIWDANKADIIKRRNEQVIIAHPRAIARNFHTPSTFSKYFESHPARNLLV